MNIIVFGASGGVGREVVKQALDKGYRVTAYVRDRSRLPIQHANLTMAVGDGMDEAAVVRVIQGQDAVLCCAGGRGMGKSTLMAEMTRHIIAGMKRHGVTRIGYVASAGIHGELNGLMGKFIMFLLRNPLADHRRAYEQLRASGLQWTVARPMSLKDDAGTGQYRESAEGTAPAGTKIARADVAHFLLRTLEDDQYVHQSVGLAD